jgi:hypothetical protein
VNKNQKKTFYKFIFIGGIFSMVFGVHLFRKTTIDVEILVIGILVVGLFSTIFILKDFQNIFNYSSRVSLYLFSMVQGIGSWGFLCCTFFLVSNFYLASQEYKEENFDIISYSSLPGRKYHRDERKPTVKIIFKGKEKELIFANKYYGRIKFYKTVNLSIRQGYWNYDIIIGQKLN